MTDDTEETRNSVEPIAYLSRSENRLEILEALTETIPKPGLDPPGYKPRELRTMTGASEATVSRVLTEFQERGWAERNAQGEYTATPLGQSMAIEFTPLLDSMAAIQNLGDAVALLPLDQLSIRLQHFGDATVVRPEGPSTLEMSRYLLELTDESSTMYSLGYIAVTQDAMDLTTEQTVSGELDPVYVQARSVREYRQTSPDQSEYREQVRSQMEAGAELYTYDGHVPCNLWIFDETVVIENSQVEGIQNGTMIESQNDTVREWALEMFGRYREASVENTIEDFDE
jgi:predicted transcriptional regulator